MAPNGNPKARNGVGVANGRLPTRRVVPAIPLPYERRVKAIAAAKQAAAQAQAASVVTLPRPAATTNGSSLKIQHGVDSPPPTPKNLQPEALVHEDKPADPVQLAPVDTATNGHAAKYQDDTSFHDSSSILPSSSDSALSDTTDKAPEPGVTPPTGHSVQGNDRSSLPTPISDKAAQIEDRCVAPAAFRPPPVIPPTRYELPPTSHNTSRPSPVVINGTSHRGPRSVHNGPPHMHGPRPSNGSLVQFGGFASNSSSPAPPHSGGFMPPNGAIPDGRQFLPHASTVNGYHQMPYGTEFVPTTAVDQFGRPLPGPAGMDQYHPYVNGYGPSTPHSFQGSHSSVQAEDLPYHYPAPGVPNGTNHVDDSRSHPPPPGAFGGPAPPQRMMPGPMPPPPMMHPVHEAHGLDSLAPFMRSQFGDLESADCTLELRYLDDRAPPVRLPGHRIILCRSQVIRNAIEISDTFKSSSTNQYIDRRILLPSDDRYLRSDAFWMAVQHLYTYPLLELPDPSSNAGFALAGNADDRFEFALGYAAAGNLIGWHPIVVRGLEIASHFLTWTNVERALGFALRDVTGRASVDRHTQFAYGNVVQILINGVINFIIDNFPPEFVLDTSVADPEEYARIPAISETPMSPKDTAGADLRLRTMQIQFGDLAVNADKSAQGPGSAASTAPRQSIQTTLSTILLNLPFALLKHTLESSGYGNVNGWASVEARHQSIRSVVMEREVRRLRALEIVKARQVPKAETIIHDLESAEPLHGVEWGVLGWRETSASPTHSIRSRISHFRLVVTVALINDGDDDGDGHCACETTNKLNAPFESDGLCRVAIISAWPCRSRAISSVPCSESTSTSRWPFKSATVEYATLHKYVLSRSRLLKRAAPSVAAVERIVDGDKAAAARQGSAPGAGSRAVDDYNARAVRHSMRVFIGTAMAMKGWALVSTKLLGAKPDAASKKQPLHKSPTLRLSFSLSTILLLYRILFRFLSRLRAHLLDSSAAPFRQRNPRTAATLTSPYAPAIGASLAGVFLGVYPSQQLRVTIAIYTLFRALEFGWNLCEEEGMIWGFKNGGKVKRERPWWWGSWLIQPFAFGQLLHAVVFDRDCFPEAYGNFIFNHSSAYIHPRPKDYPAHLKWPKAYEIVDNLAQMAKLNWPPYISPTLFPGKETLPPTLMGVAPLTSSAHPIITSLSCATLHPSDPSCLRTYLNFWLGSFPGLTRFFIIIYSAMTVLPRFRSLYNSPVTTLQRIIARSLRMSTFLTGAMSTAWASICFFQQWFPRTFLPTQRFFFGGFLAGLWAWVEKKSGRGVFLYSARVSVDSLWKVGVKRRWWRAMKGGDVWVFIMALMVTGVVYERDARAVKEGNWRKGISWVRGEGWRDWSIEDDVDDEAAEKQE
ncbi:hypothetical protein CTRI78_v007067 [Colletotrichum trifolii]|uniref:Uncharacterized protein n=1 Tax=Colletotrichum trifolii TaxID=5466 RepID=A0A4R8RA74_COLTR|nr:hypothetical protein CTRI78_v007067 [Colletotrichum trifolii]